MGRRCMIKGCTSVSSEPEHRGVSFHTFPSNAAIRQLWVEHTQMDVKKPVNRSCLVCSRHFRRADFMPYKNDKYFLKEGAVPTIFPWGSRTYVPSKTDSISEDTTLSATTSLDAVTIATDTECPSTSFDIAVPPPLVPITSGNEDVALSAPATPAPITDNLMLRKDNEKSAMKRSVSADAATPPNKLLDSKKVGKTLSLNIDSDKSIAISPIKTFDPASTFVPGARIEAQDFNKIWHHGNVVEVDNQESEVLVHFEKNPNIKSVAMNDEWIPMNSSRLRPPQPTNAKRPSITYSEGEKCAARWSDSRKYGATVMKVLENNMYELLFDDGYSKVVKGSHMSKKTTPKQIPRSPAGTGTVSIQPPPITSSTIQPIAVKKKASSSKSVSHSIMPPIPKYDVTKLNIPPLPNDGEWCCQWVNDTPIGREGYLDGPDGHKRPTVLVDDARLPAGWAKHLYQRSSLSGKWDVVLVAPNKKRFRSKADVKQFLEERGEVYNLDVYDFSIHKRRSKDLGLFVYTDDYVPPIPTKGVIEVKRDSLVSPTAGTLSQGSRSVNPAFNASSQQTDTLNKGLIQNAIDFKGFSPLSNNYSPSSTLSGGVSPSTTELTVNTTEESYVYVGSLKVQIIDNLFRCPDTTCNKNFRKENHLQIHVKHYHKSLASLLGVCPKISDLAYQRTVGQPIDEPTPKNQIPNQQFFERVYQSDLLNTRAARKSLSSPTGSIKSELKTDSTDGKQITLELTKCMEKESGKKESTLDTSFTSNNLDTTVNSSLYTSRQQTPDNHSEMDIDQPEFSSPIDAEELLQAHSVNRPIPAVIKKTSNRGGNRRGGRKKNLKKSFSDPATPSGLADFEDTRHSFSSLTNDALINQHPLPPKRTKFLQQYPDTNLENTSSQSVTTEYSNSPRYINENGELIKIVRMRQEEVINCTCKFFEEDGLMIQCELCLCWQHGICNQFEKQSQVPDKYICYYCKFPERGRSSMKYIHDQDWLYEGKLPVNNFHGSTSANADRTEALKQSHQLTGNLCELKRFMHSLNVKINIAANKDHPKMYLWSKKWEQSPKRQDIGGIERLPTAQQVKNINMGKRKESEQPIPTPDSSSEQIKPATENASILAGLLETNGSEAESVVPKSTTVVRTANQQKHIASPTSSVHKPNIPQPEAAIDPVDCQLKLLEHIDKQQSLVMARLQSIEAQVIALESLNTSIEEDPEKLPVTKKTLFMLLNDLAKIQKLAKINDIIEPFVV